MVCKIINKPQDVNTAMGVVWFAWLYVEWGSNLWIPALLHTFMNLSWVLFDVSENVLGGVYANIFRAISIALTVFYTIRMNRKTGMKVNKACLWINKKG